MFRRTHGDDPNKLLFLDIDGVLNSMVFFKQSKQYKLDLLTRRRTARQYSLDKLDLLKEIHDKTKCTIVMSSSWRIFYFDKKRTKINRCCMSIVKDLKRRGITIRYKTNNRYDKEEWKKYTNIEWVETEDGLFNTKYLGKEKTPVISKFYERGLQINDFLNDWKKKYPKVKFAILDDDVGDLCLFGNNFVNTSYYAETEDEAGLTREHVTKIVKLLND